jgi:DNA repair exonuclease SbcCD ATPase subunit
VTKAQTTCSNEKTNHDKHQEKKPADDKAVLENRKVELEQKSNTELVDCQARKKRHDDANAKMGALVAEIQTKRQQRDEWEEIANAIGGDGKTLRKIAQCYTLRFLIAHANVEIRKFNNRYELQQVRNSLGIRVIDHDRADDVRDTTSLSGGETFIVSLGLALGLSALSSRNISFENLFIDEGFGTLDHDTLETVINSLAMLQSSQGKKVGVISHTDTMSRITTQIRVIRNGSSGSSHIEIYP